MSESGIYFVGEKGTIVCSGLSGPPTLYPLDRREKFELACKDHKPENARAGFAYSGPYTEALLVGNVATRLQKRIEWDAVNMRATNAPEVDGC